MSPKVIVLELDGATWQVADRLLAAGKLPHLARIKRDGTWGVLRSFEQMPSPSLWTTIYTGKTATGHGIKSFGQNSCSVQCQRLWDILDRAKYGVGLMGTLVTWPPRPVSYGFIVPDLIMALDSRTFPSHLEYLQETMLKARFGRGASWRSIRLAWRLFRTGVHPARLMRGGLLFALDKLKVDPISLMWRKSLAAEALRADAFVHLYRQYSPDFAAYHYHAADQLGHFYWQYYEPNAFTSPPPQREVVRYQEVIPQAYIQADRLLARLLALMDSHTTLIVVSDHGEAAYPKIAARVFFDLRALIKFLGVQHDVTPVRIADIHYLYFQHSELLELVEKLLKTAFVDTTEQPAFSQIVRDGNCLSFMPCFSAFSGDGPEYVLFPGRGRLGTKALKLESDLHISGAHTADGLVVLYGHNVRAGHVLEKSSILDVTPSLLTLFGLPVARDMEGRVWWDALSLDRTVYERYVDTYENESYGDDADQSCLTAEMHAILLDRLRDLGYV